MRAQRRDRTADTGIFKPSRLAVFYEAFALIVWGSGRLLDRLGTGGTS